ncbi:type I-E CRISPR-associated protein Cas6/Cse3/CasE [Kaustia mangrovi]|uniref:Type I-E CRISPR-associated protein Cas6/Cse3/CasE n=1 Tax=Kaustia mangrovi TaxID=2593653 RepID=A0A7S8HDS7_9HYPH|nr:type I-E CRISPR-associated protein Cas6/Cse3/CasE [Kaustia mangrovi]QPC44971.1 type I-E CRISPR-associated protein Cas6/Cse3/CasE [Kaustia mangrovi]
MTDTLHLLHLPFDLEELGRWAGRRGLMSKGSFDEGFALHKLLAESFGPGVLQPFRLMPAPGGKSGTLYAYTASPADALRELAEAVAAPEHLDVVDLGRLRTKPMPQDWPQDRRLGFDIRIRPVRRSDREGDRNRTVERDAFLHEALSLPKGGMEEGGRTREAVYGEWLAAQLSRHGGARLVAPPRLASFRRQRSIRSDGHRGPEGPDAVMRGDLVITAASAFNKLLARGIGRHRAYGYGMILLRPPNGGAVTK